MLITQILATFVNLNYKSTTMELPFAESWKIKMVEPIRKSTREEREQWIKEAHYNVFQLKSEQVYIDLITDSGTGAMSDRQWAGMMLGDESYAGATSFFKLKEMITKLTGFEYIIPTHQGRAAENVLFSYLVHEGDIVPGNSHFDTTKGHIEGRHAIALDCTIDAAKQTQLEIPFKGNVDPDKLQKALTEYAERIPFIIVTITNNTAGGQPVSMQNLYEVRAFRLCTFCRECLLHQNARRRLPRQNYQRNHTGNVLSCRWHDNERQERRNRQYGRIYCHAACRLV